MYVIQSNQVNVIMEFITVFKKDTTDSFFVFFNIDFNSMHFITVYFLLIANSSDNGILSYDDFK